MIHALFAAVGILAWMTSHLGSSQCTATANHQLRSGALSEFTNLNLTGAPSDFDLLGRVYEFFLGEFSAMQGKAGQGRARQGASSTDHAASSPRWWR